MVGSERKTETSVAIRLLTRTFSPYFCPSLPPLRYSVSSSPGGLYAVDTLEYVRRLVPA